jgi:pimeloyl-ACP methyl ester carboxylesterase
MQHMVHAVEEGSGPAVLLLHQTPRSSDEFRDVVPRLAAAGLRAIAMDTPGFGASPPVAPATIPGWADAAAGLLDARGVDRAHVVGHHTGGCVAFALAARHPDRVASLVLSSTPYVDAAERAARAGRPPVADAGDDPDALRASRAPFYPADRPDLLDRFVADALRAGPNRGQGHHAVGAYVMEDDLPRVRARTLLVGAPGDPFAFPHLERLRAVLPGASVVVLDGGTVPLPDQLPGPFAEAVLAHIAVARSAQTL